MATSSASKSTLLVSLFSSLAITTSSATPVPTSVSLSHASNCRCVILPDSVPHGSSPTPIIHTFRRAPAECASLGPKLEFWHQTDPNLWPEVLRDLQTHPESWTPDLNEFKADATNHGSIVCVPETADGERWQWKPEEWKASWGTVLLGVGIIGVVIGVVAEGVELLLFRTDLFKKRKQPISLDGDEKKLMALEDDSIVVGPVEKVISEKDESSSDDDTPVL